MWIHLREMVDLMSATRSYEANVTVLNASKICYESIRNRKIKGEKYDK